MFSFTGKSSSRKEFENLALPLLDALYGTALKLTKNSEEAEDLVQDTFLKAYKHFDQFARGTNFKAWIFRILNNNFVNRYRRQSKERITTDENESQSVLSLFVSAASQDRAENPEAEVIRRDLHGEALRALTKIPENFRVVVELSDVQDFAYQEVAEILNIPIGTVMSRLFRGRKLLQEMLLPRIQEADGEQRDQPVNLSEYRLRKKMG